MPNYLYNDIELPKLPEWDKTAYPYAVIVKQGYFRNYYKLRCYSSETYYIDAEDGKRKLGGEGVSAIEYRVLATEATASTWESVGEVDTATVVGEHGVSTDNSGVLLWANFDVTNEDGSVYLAASDPVPVGGDPAPVTPFLPKNGAWQKQDAYKVEGNQWVRQPQDGYETQGGQWSALS